jgi:hypothetical protein
MGEGRAGVDNNDRCGAAINVPSATKDTEVGQGTEGGGKGRPVKEESRTANAIAMPPVVATMVVALDEEDKPRVGELLTACGSIETVTMTTQPSLCNRCNVGG